MPGMGTGLDEVDWSSMQHAYGSAEEVPALLLALRSPDAEERSKALSRFCSAVHHQGDVYPCTTASLPFLFELAGDATAPDRAGFVGLLVSIGSVAVERCDVDYGDEAGLVDYAGAAAVVRSRAEVFAGFASDADSGVRCAAIPGLGLFLDDGPRAVALLRGRLAGEPRIAGRLLVLEAMATLALRLPALLEEAMAWFAGLAGDPAADPEIRLGAVVQRARCAPEQIGEDVVPAAISLLREMAPAIVPAWAQWGSVRDTAPPASGNGAPPQIAAAFEDLDRRGCVYAPTTVLLRTFHEALAARVPQRTALLAEQLRSPHPGSRLDAIRMSGELMQSWRGDHSSLVTLVAGQLGRGSHQVAGEAGAVLGACHPIAGPAREALAAHVAAHRAAYGPDVWAAPQPQLRRAHQEAVRALARLGDARAVPSLLTALDSGVDGWRAVEVAGSLPAAADQLVPRLCDQLNRCDLAQRWAEMTARPLLSALAALADPAALPVVTETLAAAVRHGQREITTSALRTLRSFGPAAAPALGAVGQLVTASDARVRPAAVAALWSIGGDREDVMPLLQDLLEDRIPFCISQVADVLGEIGSPAAAALPRLRELLTHSYDWVRVHCAAALWDIGGDPEAPAVLDILLQAWAQNPATANHVAACLDRMGPAAAPALPQLRSQLALPRRGYRYASIGDDEELQRVSRAIIKRLT